MIELIKLFLTIAVCVGIILWVIFDTPDYDSTDNIEAKERIGLMIYTDHKTGCEYLRAGIFGGTFPRLDKNKNQLGCKDH